MYIESVPNRSSPPAILLRESFRENGRVRKRTLANLSDWPTPLASGPLLRRVGLDYHVDIDGHYYSVPHRLSTETHSPLPFPRSSRGRLDPLLRQSKGQELS